MRQVFNCVKTFAYGPNQKIIEKNEKFRHKKILKGYR